MWVCVPETFPKRKESNVRVYHTKKFQNKQALVSTKHCKIWQITMVTEYGIAELGGKIKLKAQRILANLGARRLMLAEFSKIR